MKKLKQCVAVYFLKISIFGEKHKRCLQKCMRCIQIYKHDTGKEMIVYWIDPWRFFVVLFIEF